MVKSSEPGGSFVTARNARQETGMPVEKLPTDGDWPSLRWDTRFATGHPGIDTEHQRLVRLLEKLCEIERGTAAIERLPQVLVELQRYTRYHFAHEAQLMAEHAIPAAHVQSHLAAHALFIDHLAEATRQSARDAHAVSGDLLRFLGRWLVAHILDTDRALVRELRHARKR